MQRTPSGVHREAVGDCRPPVWWVIWLGPPHAQGSVRLGRSKRLDRHLWHRFFPERGDELARDIKGWVEGVKWLVGIHEGIEATSDHCQATESESVHVIQVRKTLA